MNSSKITKDGFTNEKSICKKFDNWKEYKEAQEWLKVIGGMILKT